MQGISLNLIYNSHMNSDPLCPKCRHPFSQDLPPKKLINCSHSLCHACLVNELICPVDRTRIEKRKYTLEAFQINHSLLQLALSKEEGNKESESNQIDLHAYSSQSNKSYPKSEFATPINAKYTPSSSNQEREAEVVVELPCLSPQKHPHSHNHHSPSRLTISPKSIRLNFDTCLLHSKKADLICLQDRCLICANCGLFGQHKLHKILPYDQFLAQYSNVTEESFQIYEQLKEREEILNQENIRRHIDETLREKRDAEVRNIKSNIASYIDFLKKMERQLITDLDTAIAYKKKKLGQTTSMGQLLGKKEKYILQIQAMSSGVDDIFNLENIGHYIDYIDKESPSSYIINEGEYLLVEIDNAYKQKINMIVVQAEDVQFHFNMPLEHIRESVHLQSKDGSEINALIQEGRKKLQQKQRPYGKITAHTPLRTQPPPPPHSHSIKSQLKMSPTVKNGTQDDPLLIGTNSKSGSKSSSGKIIKQHSPMQPYTSFQFDLSNKKTDIQTSLLTVHQFNPSLSRSKKTLDNKKGGELSQSRMNNKSRTKSTHNQSQSEREGNILAEKSENQLRKKKLDLPQKYQRVFDQLQKDKLQVLDLGGAFLGQGTILSISELFPSRGKLRTAKLMNNKIGDDAFPQVLLRCRQLTSLNLSYNLLSEKSLDVLEQQVGSLGELKNITLSNNKIVLRNVRDRLEGLARRGIKVSL